MSNTQDNERRRVSSLRELPGDIQPPRDLWSGIESQILAETRREPSAPRRDAADSVRYVRRHWMAIAAAVACLAVGVWLGRNVLPVAGHVTTNPTHPSTALDVSQMVQAAYIADPRFREQRAELVKSLQSRLAALPPESREKVIQSLATIHRSMQDLQSALGRDPSNALLQELLVNTYQDEMRVLTAVHEASEAGKGI